MNSPQARMTAPRAARWLWIGAFAVATACNEGHKMPSPPFESNSTTWNELTVPGVELAIKYETASHRAWGAARLDGSSRDLYGKEAFDAVRGKAGNDPTTLATLAMLFLDEGVAGKKPWTQPTGPQVADQQAIARPPAVSDDSVVYWRFHAQLADLVRCRAALSTGKVTCELGGDVLQAELVAKDPGGAAKHYLASDNANTRIRGIEALGQAGDDASRAQLIDIVLNTPDPRERKAAVEVLGKLGGTGVVAALGRSLLYDKVDEVRQVAASALGQLRDPAGRGALEQAMTADTDARVHVLAAEALKKLK